MPQVTLKKMINPYSCPHCKAKLDHIHLDGIWFRCELTDDGKIVLPRMLTPQRMGQLMREESSPFVCPECNEEIDFEPDDLPEFETHRKHQIQRFIKALTAHIIGKEKLSRRLRAEIEYLAMQTAIALDEDSLDDQVAAYKGKLQSSER